jgi:hypothetical protein
MPTKIWMRDQQSDMFHKGELVAKCYRAHRRVWIAVEAMRRDPPFITDSIVADYVAAGVTL